MSTYLLNIPDGYKVDRECPIDWDIDGSAIISIEIRPISNIKYEIIKPYQVRADNQIIEIPIGTKIIEEQEKYATTLIIDYTGRDLKGKRRIKKSVCEYNSEYFKPIINESIKTNRSNHR